MGIEDESTSGYFWEPILARQCDGCNSVSFRLFSDIDDKNKNVTCIVNKFYIFT